MIDRLTAYYKQQGISPEQFRCMHYRSCASTCPPERFATAKAPYVGTAYERGVVPRLLFLSFDPGYAEMDPKCRMIGTERGDTWPWMPDGSYRPEIRRHWYRTHQFVWVVFDALNRRFDLRLDIGRTDGNREFVGRDIAKIKPYFAHTNSAKCCMNNNGRSQAHAILFENCRPFIPGEIEVLDPHVLVTQGARAAEVILANLGLGRAFAPTSVAPENVSHADEKHDFAVIRLRTGKTVAWVRHFHPQARAGQFTRNLAAYGTYAERIADFLGSTYPDLVRRHSSEDSRTGADAAS